MNKSFEKVSHRILKTILFQAFSIFLLMGLFDDVTHLRIWRDWIYAIFN